MRDKPTNMKCGGKCFPPQVLTLLSLTAAAPEAEPEAEPEPGADPLFKWFGYGQILELQIINYWRI